MREKPWLVGAAIEQMDRIIRPEWIGWEWGSGGSTAWLARRLAQLTSIEHDAGWQELVLAALQELDIWNVDLRHVEQGDGYYLEYADTILDMPDESLDLILVDGRARPRCIHNAVPKLRPGGMLILDNSERQAYQAAIAEIPSGWQRRDYTESWRTTIWVRPA